eukprot:1392094-Rhodomonas_salina.10
MLETIDLISAALYDVGYADRLYCYAKFSTEIGYAATRCSALRQAMLLPGFLQRALFGVRYVQRRNVGGM